MTTVDQIASTAFTAVAASITDAVQTCVVRRVTQGAYDPEDGSFSETTTENAGRVVEDTQGALPDLFPNWVIGPKDRLFWIEGLDALSPRETDELVVGGVTYIIKQTGDVVGAGGLYGVVANG